MARTSFFERDLKVATSGLDPQAISALLAKTARKAVADAIADGSGAPGYQKFVNGRPGAEEESVQAPGPIVYLFNRLPEIAAYALAFAIARSPARSGRYKKSWFVMADGQQTAPEAIPPGAEVIITNDQPYSRKIEVGHMKMSVPPGVAENTRQAVQAKFGEIVRVDRRFVSLAGGYVLKGRRGRRKARRSGGALTYPAVVINLKV